MDSHCVWIPEDSVRVGVCVCLRAKEGNTWGQSRNWAETIANNEKQLTETQTTGWENHTRVRVTIKCVIFAFPCDNITLFSDC